MRLRRRYLQRKWCSSFLDCRDQVRVVGAPIVRSQGIVSLYTSSLRSWGLAIRFITDPDVVLSLALILLPA
jgi:hypothetical protein